MCREQKCRPKTDGSSLSGDRSQRFRLTCSPSSMHAPSAAQSLSTALVGGLLGGAAQRDRIARPDVRRGGASRDAALVHQREDLLQDPREGHIHPTGIQRTRLDEREVVALREFHRLLRGHRAQVSEVGLVADEHDDDVGLGVLPKLPKPPLYVLKSQVLGDVVHQQRAHGACGMGGKRRSLVAEVIARYRSCPAVSQICAWTAREHGHEGPLAARSNTAAEEEALHSFEPNLDPLRLDLYCLGGELDADGGLGFQVELVAGEPREEIGFPDARVADQHHCAAPTPSQSAELLQKRFARATLPLNRKS
eukprot:scaffold90_cov264-Pinguiococcus_pyrenoidosus.AAC.10